MNLADMLSYADIHDLSRIARNYDCECDGHSKNDLIQSILSTVSRREVFERQVLGLTMEDIRFLNSLLFDQRNSFSLEELVARVQQTKFMKEENRVHNPRDTISSFKQKGWLFNGFSQQTKYLFQVPNDLKKRFGDVLFKQFQQQTVSIEEPAAYRDEQMMITEDIHLFLKYLFQQDVVLTAEGFMYKRTLSQIQDSFNVKEDPVGKSAWRFGYGRRFKEYPNRFSFIYDYCYYAGLIVESGDRLSLTEQGMARVQDRKKEDLSDVYRFWLRLYKNPIPNLQSIVQWVDRLCRHWVTAASLGQVLCQLIRPFYYDSSESIFEQRILQLMMHLGLLRIGEDEREGTVVQMTKLGSSLIQGTYVKDEDKIQLQLDRPSSNF